MTLVRKSILVSSCLLFILLMSSSFGTFPGLFQVGSTVAGRSQIHAPVAAASSTSAWTQISPSTFPPARSDPAMVYDPADGYIVMFGGRSTSGGALGDTWTYSGGTWSQLSPTVSPPARYAASMVYDAADGYILLFGGVGASGNDLGDTWAFKAGTWTQIQTSNAPAAREYAGMAYDAADGYTVLFGGISGLVNPSCPSGGCSYYSDTWTYSNGAWSKLSPSSSPSARGGAGMTYDSTDGYVVLFGGSSDYCCSDAGLSDTWKFAAGSWTPLSPSTNPSDRYQFTMPDDPAIGGVLLFGGWVPAGACGSDAGDTWEFAGGSWTQLTTSVSPPARADAGLAYDGNSGGAILFGGMINVGASPSSGCGTPEVQSDTWQFGSGSSPSPLGVTVKPTSDTITLGESVTFTATFSGGTSPYTCQWLEEGPGYTSYSDFGSSSSCTSPASTYVTPSSPGTWQFELQVTDSESPTDTVTSSPVSLQVSLASGTGLIGIKNIVDISNIAVNSGDDACLIFVASTTCYSIQQNFEVITPLKSGGQYAYWAQNVVVVGSDEALCNSGYAAFSNLEVFSLNLISDSVSSLNYPVPIFGACISTSNPITLTSQILSGELSVSVSSGSLSISTYTCPLPATFECVGGASSNTGSYIFASGPFAYNAPELDIVAPCCSAILGATADFLSSSSGSVQSEVDIANSGWTSEVTQMPLLVASTGEKSAYLNWIASPSSCTSSPCTATFAYSLNGGYQGVVFLPTGYQSTVIFDATPIDGEVFVSSSSAVLTVTEGGTGSTCSGGTTAAVSKIELPYLLSAPAGTNVCYTYQSIIASTLPLEKYEWSSTSVNPQSNEFMTETTTITVVATYDATGPLVILVDSPVNILVTDPTNHQAGFELDGTAVNQIAGATLEGPCSTTSDQIVSITIPDPIPGDYQITTYPSCATSGGSPYTISVQGPSGIQTYSSSASQGGVAQTIFASLDSSGGVTISTSPIPTPGVPQFPFFLVQFVAIMGVVLIGLAAFRRRRYHSNNLGPN